MFDRTVFGSAEFARPIIGSAEFARPVIGSADPVVLFDLLSFMTSVDLVRSFDPPLVTKASAHPVLSFDPPLICKTSADPVSLFDPPLNCIADSDPVAVLLSEADNPVLVCSITGRLSSSFLKLPA